MKNKYVPYLLLLPAFLLICICKIYPVLTTLRQAFVVEGALSLATFQRVFSEKTFWNCLKVTMKFNVVTVPLQILISFVLAFLLGGLVVWQHRANIRRLLAGNENKLSFHKKKA